MAAQILQIDQREDGRWKVEINGLPEAACESESLCDALSRLATITSEMLLASRGQLNENCSAQQPAYAASEH